MFYTAALCGSFNDQPLLGGAEQSAPESEQPLLRSRALVTGTGWVRKPGLKHLGAPICRGGDCPWGCLGWIYTTARARVAKAMVKSIKKSGIAKHLPSSV